MSHPTEYMAARPYEARVYHVVLLGHPIARLAFGFKGNWTEAIDAKLVQPSHRCMRPGCARRFQKAGYPWEANAGSSPLPPAPDRGTR